LYLVAPACIAGWTSPQIPALARLEALDLLLLLLYSLGGFIRVEPRPICSLFRLGEGQTYTVASQPVNNLVVEVLVVVEEEWDGATEAQMTGG
jgi:hypothetical protein